jgi:hypothetical protein
MQLQPRSLIHIGCGEEILGYPLRCDDEIPGTTVAPGTDTSIDALKAGSKNLPFPVFII